MSSRTEPPVDSKEASEFKAGDEVYYYRSGKPHLLFFFPSLTIFLSSFFFYSAFPGAYSDAV